MANVWYIGSSDERKITAQEWAFAGFPGASDSEWTIKNGWAISEDVFTEDQLAFFDAHREFLTGQTGLRENPIPVLPVMPVEIVGPLSGYYIEIKDLLRQLQLAQFINSGDGPPSAGPANVFSQLYLNTSNGNIHRWNVATETWSDSIGNIKGPAGTTGNAAPASHGDDPDFDRPITDGAVIWVGSVEPVNAVEGDVWFDITGDPPDITTTTLSAMNVGVHFSADLVCIGTVPITFTVVSGELPDGLVLSSEGQLSGAPTATGAFAFTVRATNGFGTNDQPFSGTVGAAVAPTITTTSLPAMNQGSPIAPITLQASGSVPMTWAVTTGSLPAGLSLNASTGVVSGTPSAASAYSFTVTASNSAGSDPQPFSGTVGAPLTPVITTTSLGEVLVGQAFNLTLAATGSVPIAWTVSVGTLPAGLSLNSSTGVLSGTPTTPGAYSFTVQAENAAGTDTQAFTGTVDAAAVTFDSTATNSGTTSPIAVATNASAGSTGLLFVTVVTNGGLSSLTANYDGEPMTQHGSTITQGPFNVVYYTHLAVFKLEDLEGGSKAISVAAAATIGGYFHASFVSYDGVEAIGALQSKTAVAAGMTHDVATDEDHIAAQCFFMANGTSMSGYNKTQRGATSRSVVGDAAGEEDGSVAFSAIGAASGGNYTYASAAVDLSPN